MSSLKKLSWRTTARSRSMPTSPRESWAYQLCCKCITLENLFNLSHAKYWGPLRFQAVHVRLRHGKRPNMDTSVACIPFRYTSSPHSPRVLLLVAQHHATSRFYPSSPINRIGIYGPGKPIWQQPKSTVSRPTEIQHANQHPHRPNDGIPSLEGLVSNHMVVPSRFCDVGILVRQCTVSCRKRGSERLGGLEVQRKRCLTWRMGSIYGRFCFL